MGKEPVSPSGKEKNPNIHQESNIAILTRNHSLYGHSYPGSFQETIILKMIFRGTSFKL
jgi:hypothetical protein